jgi:hypothetical protein
MPYFFGFQRFNSARSASIPAASIFAQVAGVRRTVRCTKVSSGGFGGLPRGRFGSSMLRTVSPIYEDSNNPCNPALCDYNKSINRSVQMDHGELNLPLSKRGNLNVLFGVRRADVERSQHVAEKEAVVARKAAKAQAKELLAMHEAAILARHGERFGVKALRDQLDQWAKWEPAKLISFVGKFLAEGAAQ